MFPMGCVPAWPIGFVDQDRPPWSLDRPALLRPYCWPNSGAAIHL